MERNIGASFPIFLEDGDKCFYARDYISKGRYQDSEANNLIKNFKKSMDRKGRPEWRHKKLAIKQFARELNIVIPDNRDNIVVTRIPSSKRTADSDYDPRFEETLSYLKEMKPLIAIDYPLKALQTTLASHIGGNRNIESIYENLEWLGFSTRPEIVILIDDVITTGAHFKACKRLILENHPEISVFGIFWAKTMWV